MGSYEQLETASLVLRTTFRVITNTIYLNPRSGSFGGGPEINLVVRAAGAADPTNTADAALVNYQGALAAVGTPGEVGFVD